jgi:SprB repeat
MAITLIENQAIRFQLLTDIEAEACNCSYKNYCQLVNKFDAGKFQLESSNIVNNGSFGSNLDGWNIKEALSVSLVTDNETSLGLCDGDITVSASGGTGPYTYSKGGTFQVGNTFTALCVGCYSIIVKDSLGNLGFATGCVATNVDCASYSSPYLFDLNAIDLANLANCELFDLV